MNKEKKSPYQVKDQEQNLKEPLLSPSSTHPTSQASPRRYDEFDSQDAGKLTKLSMKSGLMAFEEIKKERHFLKKEAVNNENLVSEGQFLYLEELVENLPGHNTSQMVFAITLMRTRSVGMSFLNVLLYHLPSLLVIIVISQLDRYYNEFYARTVWSPKENFFKFYMAVFILGICQAVVGLLLNNAMVLFNKRGDNNFNMILMIVSAFITIMNSSYWVLFFILITWGVLCVLRGEENKFVNKPVSAISTSTEGINFLGTPALITFGTLFLGLNILMKFHFFHSIYTYLMTSFFTLGTFTLTGGHSLFPLALTQFRDDMTKMELLKGLALASFLPGPVSNFAAFVGGVLGGVIASIVSVFAFVLPGLLLLMAILSFPESLKFNATLRNFLIGLNLASIGFIFAAAYKVYIESVWHNPYVDVFSSSFNVLLAFTALFWMNMIVPVALLIGGGFTMLYSLVYFQMFH
jgi:putative chromate ion transporter